MYRKLITQYCYFEQVCSWKFSDFTPTATYFEKGSQYCFVDLISCKHVHNLIECLSTGTPIGWITGNQTLAKYR